MAPEGWGFGYVGTPWVDNEEILHDPTYLLPWELQYCSMLRPCKIF